MSRAQLTSTVEQNSGGAVAPFLAGKNFAINGGMDFIQRGAVSSVTGARYVLDRWFSTPGGTYSVSQQSSGVPIGLQYCARMTLNASSSYVSMYQFLETMTVAPLWGRAVTLTAKIRRNSSFAANIQMALAKSATVDAGSGATWSSIGSVTVSNASIPTGTTSSDWYTISLTVNVPADGSANSLRIQFDPSVVSTTGDYWELTAVQLEVGSVATPFSRAGGTVQGELALCQRYYEVINPANSVGLTFGGISTGSAQAFYFPYAFSVAKRVTPTLSKNGTWSTSNAAQPQALFPQPSGLTIYGQNTASGAWYVQATDATQSITASAEL